MPCALACLFLASLTPAFLPQATSAQTVITIEWSEYSGNPAFDPAAKAYYPTVAQVSSSDYRMWYGSDSGVGYATSSDGISSWTEVQNPVSGLTNAAHPHVEYYPDGFTCGASTCYFRIWYWDETQLYAVASIRYAESVDGMTWVNDQAVSGNIITGVDGDWNKGSYGPIDVLYNPDASNTGTNPFDYSFAMYFDGTDGAFEEIGLGYSSDGKSWTLHDKVFPRGNAGAWGNTDDWDSSYATFGTIIKESDGNWHMWYSGGQAASSEGIGYATSSDGLTWTRSANNPIFHKNDGVAWRNARTYTPAVIQDNGPAYKMWFGGRDTAAGNYAVGYATASRVVDVNVADTVSMTDTVTARTPFTSRSLEEALTVGDNIVANTPVTSRSPSDSVAVTEDVSRLLDAGRAASETLAVADSITSTTLRSVSVSDSLSVAEAIAMSVSRSVSDALAVADDIVARTPVISRDLSDTLTVSDAAARTTLTPATTSRGGGGGGAPVDVTTYPEPYFSANPLARVQMRSTAFTNAQGLDISDAKSGQQVKIAIAFKNYQRTAQDYAVIIQITDSNGFTTDIGWAEGKLLSGQTTEVARSWTPTEPSVYRVQMFVWDGISRAPTPLSEVTESSFRVT